MNVMPVFPGVELLGVAKVNCSVIDKSILWFLGRCYCVCSRRVLNPGRGT